MPETSRSRSLVSPLSILSVLAGALIALLAEHPHMGAPAIARFVVFFAVGVLVVTGLRLAWRRRSRTP